MYVSGSILLIGCHCDAIMKKCQGPSCGRIAHFKGNWCCARSYAVQTVGSRDQPWPFSSLIMQSNALMLIPRLPKGILRMVNEFAGRCRCDLCSEGTAVAVKSAGIWQYWCIDCCVWQLPDMTRLNIHAAEHSLDGNHFAEGGKHFAEGRIDEMSG